MPDEPFYIGDDDRFGRFRLIGWWDQQRLASARVLVVGAGALGNEAIKNLALLGVGHVTIIDLDEIEASNLSRSVLFRASDRGRAKAVVAAEAAAGLHPEIVVRPIVGNVLTDLGLGLFADADVVLGCLDNREARLWVNQCCWKVGTPWVDAGIQEISGTLKVFVPPGSACYECGMTDNDYRLINLRYSCPLLKRDEILAGKVPTAPTISSILAGMQCQEALKIIHGMDVDAGTVQVFHGASSSFYKTRIQRRDDCLSHVTYENVIETDLTAAGATPNDIFAVVQERLAGSAADAPGPPDDGRSDGDTPDVDTSDGGSGPTLRLDRDLVTAIEYADGRSVPVMRPLAGVRHADAVDAAGQTGQPRMTHTVVASDPLAGRPLAELGVPAYDIVTVTIGPAEHRVLLGGDRTRAGFTAPAARPDPSPPDR